MADNESLISQRLTSPVRLNVYDVINNTFNRFLHLVGFGFYHTCVQVHGKQYMFKAGEGEGSGIVSGEQETLPWCEGLHKRVSILIGQTRLDENQVQDVIQELGSDYTQNSYNIFTNNSNHFANQLCLILTGNQIPSWVNRVAFLCGVYCGCMLPVDKVNEEVRRIALISAGVNEDPNDGNYDADDEHNGGGDADAGDEHNGGGDDGADDEHNGGGDHDDDDDDDLSLRRWIQDDGDDDDDDDDDDDEDFSLRRLLMASRKYEAETSAKAREDDIIASLSSPSTSTNMPDLLRRGDEEQ